MFNKYFKSSFLKISFLIFVFSFFINTNITKADTTIYQKNTDPFASTPKDNKNYWGFILPIVYTANTYYLNETISINAGTIQYRCSNSSNFSIESSVSSNYCANGTFGNTTYSITTDIGNSVNSSNCGISAHNATITVNSNINYNNTQVFNSGNLNATRINIISTALIGINTSCTNRPTSTPTPSNTAPQLYVR